MPNLAEKIEDYIRAGNTALWVQSYEHEEAQAELAALCKGNSWVLFNWDAADGLQLLNTGVSVNWQKPAEPQLSPVHALQSLEKIANEMKDRQNMPTTPSTLLILRNVHGPLADNNLLKQTLIKEAFLGRKSRAFVIVLAPNLLIPPEMEKLFTVVEHDLPTPETIKKIAKTLAIEDGEYPSTPEEEQAMVMACAGMSRVEAENAISLSIIRHNTIRADEIWKEKSHALLKDGLLELHTGPETFAGLGGLQHLKEFHLDLLAGHSTNPLARPKGTLLLSPPGCGKSGFCKALGHETNRPVLGLDIGALMGGRLGQSEAQTRRALKTIDAMAPCILFVDEVEKGLAGIAGNGSSDGGVAQRMFGTILKWMNDHTSDVFTICTCNDISRIMATNPEFARAERFDGMFFIDLPDEKERDKIWPIYLKAFGIKVTAENPRPDDTGWTGAEIRSCCRLATMLQLSLKEAAKLVVPIVKTASEQIDALQTWAVGRCLSASKRGRYGETAKLSNTTESEVTQRVISRVKSSGNKVSSS